MKWNLSPANIRCCSIETRSIRSHSRKPNTKNHFHHVFIKVQVQTVHSSLAVSSNPAAAAVSTTAKPKAHVKSEWPSYHQDCIWATHSGQVQWTSIIFAHWAPVPSCSSKSKWHVSENHFFSWESDAGWAGELDDCSTSPDSGLMIFITTFFWPQGYN